MPTKITNKHNIEVAPAVWLLEDFYDYNDDPHAVSATGLLKPIRPVVLAAQTVGDPDYTMDIVDMIGSRVGSALHDSLEDAWKDFDRVKTGLTKLGIKEQIIKRIRINPGPLDLKTIANIIPVYIENRTSKKIGKWTVSGKYDLVFDGEVQDYKSGSVWGYIFDSNSADYIMQGSIYRWLNPEKITHDTVTIHYIFTDWSKQKALQDKKYPQTRILSKRYKLKPLDWTEQWIRNKLDQIEMYIDKPQEQLPLCTPEELWQKDSVWKYYKNPANKARATKNFTSESEAHEYFDNVGRVGELINVPGEVKRCHYCSSVEICTQAKNFIKTGLLKFD